MDADIFAERALRAVARNEAIIVVPGWWKAFWYLERLSPALSSKLWGVMFARLREELVAAGAKPAQDALPSPDDKAARAG